MALVKRLRRVAIVGLPNSGKTILLTSLLMHLHALSDKLQIKKKNGFDSLSKCRDVTPETVRKLQTFPFEQYRRILAEKHCFPKNTVSESIYTVDLEMTNGKEYQIELLDVPGERFYDLEMHGRNYSQWCDSLENLWEKDPHPAMHKYRELLDQNPAIEEKSILVAYREVLAHLIADYRSCITPSSFRINLDAEKNKIKGRCFDDILRSAELNPCGRTQETQFAPIFRKQRDQYKLLADKLSNHYEYYKEGVVNNLHSQLVQCDRMLILVDIPNILMAGPAAYNEQDHLIERVLSALIPVRGALSSTGRFFRDGCYWIMSLAGRKYRPGSVENVAFIATKSDLIANGDATMLKDLLLQLCKNKSSYLEGIQPFTRTLSAIKSTIPIPHNDDDCKTDYLYGKVIVDPDKLHELRNPEQPAVSYTVSRLPKAWPMKWEKGDYYFPPVYPDIPQIKSALPEQSGLEFIFQFIIGEVSNDEQ